MSDTAPCSVDPRLEGEIQKVSLVLVCSSRKPYSVDLLPHSNLDSLVFTFFLPRSIGITGLPAEKSHFPSEPRRSSILPHPQPLAPLLNHTVSPTSTLSLPIFPSTHNPLSRAHLLVVPRFPPECAEGVTHPSPRQKYGVVILPSMISPFWLTSKISFIGELKMGGGRSERAVI